MAKENKENDKERSDKERNRDLIRGKMLAYFAEHGKIPSIRQLAELTGIHFNTVSKHVREMEFTPLESPLRVLTPEVLSAIYKRAVGYEEDAVHFSSFEGSVTQTPYKKAIAPDPVAQKLFLQVMEGWSEKQKMEHSGEVSMTFNYVAPEAPAE